MKIELDSLVLKSYDGNNRKHLKFKYSLENDEEFKKYFGQFFIKKIDEIFAHSEDIEINKAYMIEDKDDIVGMIRIFKQTFDGTINLQYAVAKDYRRSGYGTVILKEISNYLMHNKDISCITLDIDKNNIGSIKCATNLGYVKEDKEKYVRNR